MSTGESWPVILIGGAPGAGKSTLGAAAAARLGIASLTIDDLMTAAQAVTTPQSHPGLHAMRRVSAHAYFTNSTIDQLKSDADAQHEAMWPVIERVIRKHATHGPGAVIDGWHLRPQRVAELKLANVSSFWLVAEPAVLEAREHANRDWLRGSADPDRMLANFLARSLLSSGIVENCSQSGETSNVFPVRASRVLKG